MNLVTEARESVVIDITNRIRESLNGCSFTSAEFAIACSIMLDALLATAKEQAENKYKSKAN